ncbi:MAG: DUF5050 domain-containing protein [Anaerolineae bacterium]|nr:DUF5050 domain-containing protein [Anaerolineae bacterium]
MSKGVPFANPYVIDKPIVEASHFYGRLDLLDWIESSLDKGQPLLVVQGPHRIGKSSLLHQLPTHLGSKYMVFLVGEVADSRLDLLLWQIALAMTGSLPEEAVFSSQDPGGEEPKREDFEGQASYFGEKFLPRLSKVVGGRRLLLALDDFHLWAGGDSGVQAELLSYLTSLKLNLLLTWEGPAGEMLSPALIWRLGPLDRKEAERLITEPSAEILEYDYEAQERILALTSGHPYFVQLLCYALLERCASKGWVLVQDVDEVVPESMALGESYLEHLLAAFPSQERVTLAALGAMRGIHGLILEEEVCYLLQRRRIPLSPEELRVALHRLVERGILVNMGPHTYRFQVELLRVWLGKAEGFRESLFGERTPRGKGGPGLERFFWPMAAALLVIVLFLWSTRSRSQPPTGGEGGAIPATPTTLGAIGVSPTQTQPPSQTIAYMFWEEESGSWEIYLMASDGSNRTPLTQNEVNDTWPSWSYDGRRLLFVSERDGNREIYLMNADGSEQVNLSRNPAPDSHPSFSPDGTKIAFASHRDGNWEIYIMDGDGSDQARVTFNEEPDYAPVWSPDGTKIGFVSERDGNTEVYVMETDRWEATRLTSNEATDTSPAWSPDGTKIAFESYRDNDMEIYIVNADGSGQRTLTNDHTADDHGPSWSPDGSQIVYFSNRDGNWDIYRIGVDGTGRVNLTNSAEGEQGPAWRP